jgi:hypothetical protein
MPFQTCQGALMLCSFGMTPSPLSQPPRPPPWVC